MFSPAESECEEFLERVVPVKLIQNAPANLHVRFGRPADLRQSQAIIQDHPRYVSDFSRLSMLIGPSHHSHGPTLAVAIFFSPESVGFSTMPSMVLTTRFLKRLNDSLAARNLGEGTVALDGAAEDLARLNPKMQHATDLLLCVVQWIDVGYADHRLTELLLKRFPAKIRQRMPLADYLRLRMAEACRAMAAEDADQAIEILEFVMKAERELNDQKMIALAHFWIGRAHRKKGEYEIALKHIVQARKMTSALPESAAATAVIQIHESWLLFQKNHRKDAWRLLDEAEAALKSTDYPLALANIESARGRIVRRSGEYTKALEHFERAIAIYSSRHPDHGNLARVLVNSAYVKRLVALQLRKKIDSKARPTRSSDPGSPDLKSIDRSLHARYHEICREAHDQLNRAEKIYLLNENHGGVGSVLMNRGQLHLDDGDFENAARIALRAYRLAHERNDHILMARARILQAATENAHVDEQLGEDADIAVHASTAMKYCDEALVLAEHTQNRRLLARAYLTKGETVANDFLKDWDRAKECVALAMPLVSSGDRDQLWEELTALKSKIVSASGVDDALRAWSDGIVGDKTFQQVTEEFAEIVIPKVWEREGRKISRVAERLSISPKKVRRILRNVGMLNAQEA
jgi:tetratricopeptide (TPR) repeat protein